MGKFDEQIAWCREQCDEAREFLEDLESGLSLATRRGDEEWTDTTESWKKKLRDDIDKLEKLIKTYEKKMSKDPKGEKGDS